MPDSPEKTLKVSGKATVSVSGNRLIVEATGGLVAAFVADTEGSLPFVYHPLSGWYVERGGYRDEPNTENGQAE